VLLAATDDDLKSHLCRDCSHPLTILNTLFCDLLCSFLRQSIVNEVAKAVVANYDASELLTRRDAVSREIEVELVRQTTIVSANQPLAPDQKPTRHL